MTRARSRKQRKPKDGGGVDDSIFEHLNDQGYVDVESVDHLVPDHNLGMTKYDFWYRLLFVNKKKYVALFFLFVAVYLLYLGYWIVFLAFFVGCIVNLIFLRTLYGFKRERVVLFEIDEDRATFTPYSVGQERFRSMPFDADSAFQFRHTKSGDPVLCTWSLDKKPIVTADANRVNAVDVIWNIKFIRSALAELSAMWKRFRDKVVESTGLKYAYQVEYGKKLAALLDEVISPEVDQKAFPSDPSPEDIPTLRAIQANIRERGGDYDDL